MAVIFLIAALSYFSVYHFSGIVTKIYFFALVALQLYSKDQRIWLILLMFYSFEPGDLFSSATTTSDTGLPQFDIVGGLGFKYIEVLLYIMLYKVFRQKRTVYSPLWKRSFLPIIVFGVWLSVYSMITFDFDFRLFVAGFRQLTVLSLFYSIPRILKNEDFPLFINSVFLFTFIVVSNQVGELLFGYKFLNTSNLIENQSIIEGEFIRAITSLNFQFLTIMLVLVVLAMKQRIKKQVIFVLLMALLSIVLTGIRGWIIAFSFVLISYFYTVLKMNIQYISRALLLIIVVIGVFRIIPSISDVLTSSFERLSTVSSVASGDLTADGTLKRITVRLPRILIGVRENVFFGHGFTKTFFQYKDGHVGWANQLLQFGVFGMLFFVRFLILFPARNKMLWGKVNNQYKDIPKVVNIMFFAILIIHFTSRTMFNYTMSNSILFLVVYYLSISDCLLRLTLNKE